MSVSRFALVCLGLSFFSVLAASEIFAEGFDFTPSMPAVDQPGHKEWIWDGGRSLGLGVPAILHYRRGGPARIVITGPEELLRHVRVGDGRIESDHDWSWHSLDGGDRLDITVSGVPLDHVSLAGGGKLLLGHLEQDTFSIDIGGSGTASAEGKVDHLRVNIGGSGKVEFAQLASADARVTIAGSGDVAVAPANQADVTIAGSGEVRLQTKPAHLHSAIIGSGRILLADKDGGYSDVAPRAHAPLRIDY